MKESVAATLINYRKMKRIAYFAGSFDPFTIGHQSIVDRAMGLFDLIVIGVGVNGAKRSRQTPQERVEAIRALYAQEPRVAVESYEGLTVEAARRAGAQYLLRGVRSVADFEYERQLADINRNISSLESVLLLALPEYGSVSSSMVRELESYGVDVSRFLPIRN